MANNKIETQVAAFCSEWQGLGMIYEDYARSAGIPYTTLYILAMIADFDGCTQKKICERTFLPKQTVNAVVSGFLKSGYVELRALPEDRRNKAIHLTKKGAAYAEKIIPQIHCAERSAMERLSQEQREQLIASIRLYCEAFKMEMKSTQ